MTNEEIDMLLAGQGSIECYGDTYICLGRVGDMDFDSFKKDIKEKSGIRVPDLAEEMIVLQCEADDVPVYFSEQALKQKRDFRFVPHIEKSL